MIAWVDGGVGREAGVSGGEASVVPLQKLEVAASVGKVRVKCKSKNKRL